MHQWEYTPTYRGFDTFYGYYDADEDYYTHMAGGEYRNPDNPKQMIHTHGVDFRSNKDPVTDKNGSYSTNLFTRAIEEAIFNHDASEGPFFVYGAYQSIHGPLEVPEHYLNNCAKVTNANRKIICGMMQALDEGINNITMMLESKGYLSNTVIILTTDNGGQTALGSSNWPLRGNKATVFEGGVRGFSFVWSKMLSKTNYDNSGLMHITDWYRTIVEGVAGLKMSDNETKGLDGFNMWQTITENAPSNRSEILLQLNPPSYTNPRQPFVGQAALRSGDWKLIMGKPDCADSAKCPTGWVHMDGSIDPPPDNPSQIWLFNVTADPNEKNNMAGTFQDIVALMQKRIEAFNSTHVAQLNPPFDPKSDPKNFGGVWTPWLN
jgi:arylsulfatase B/arylsulfatase I/J